MIAFSRRDHLYETVSTGFRGPLLSAKSPKGSTALKRLGATGLEGRDGVTFLKGVAVCWMIKDSVSN